MKKYKELVVYCGSDENALRGIVSIGEMCQGKPFGYSEDMERLYQADDRMNHILVDLPGIPSAVILVYASDGTIKVLNIVPFNHSCDYIEKDVYNNIVDEFNEKVINPLFKGKYRIESSKEDVSIQDYIPLSYRTLYRWAHCPGAPNSPFSHQNDLEMWFDFLCELHITGEELSSGDLEQWLLEDIGWNEKVVIDAIIRFETERDLLNYYDKKLCQQK